MKLGVFAVLFGQKSLEEALDFIASKGLQAIEIGTGGFPGDAHCKPDELLADEGKLKAFKKAVESRGLTISALSCHGNALHPQKQIAKEAHDVFVKTVKLAERLEVPVVNTFSGCPGDHEDAKYPNWPIAPWPNDFQEILAWQWENKIIPYWKETGQLASDHNVKIGLELHGGFSVHTPGTLLRLREAVGEVIGANLDPSHMWWQGIDPVQAVQILGRAGAIHHFHAKDTAIDPFNVNKHGVTDMQPYTMMLDRAWQFRTVGFGHDNKTWADIISALRLVGYDYVVSIEHEDGLMSVNEGFTKAVENLKQVLIEEPLGDMWWV
ncbi:AP endonuclease, family 2 [Paenibacillus larvae subsp. larvae]|uniref:AP endonuclease, family 2 n=1 Tax=Paenibacillus larvae subsp. larvae TaxID=147375 RepID=A0A2L1TUV9_9BACL|nr:sugar phosphate isomerase/epimerase [Paenibacillus larvae]AQT85135.1 xylose isomerase [Paenibacillus larvae subsp. pulvifaciens]AQZ47134.1 xylose isomerase [Paenibacillus larvae subsp. pulvifaciens]AVF24418.1 AP endonuclease, family 2 [Paenibacillus larvae subsp. larvae]AVF29179.1 AP endonuclease, family 2 [Paenibacillus larvae subsp. larvae]MBH0342330.1 xylose isomerase [Paenibacillus larvae]